MKYIELLDKKNKGMIMRLNGKEQFVYEKGIGWKRSALLHKNDTVNNFYQIIYFLRKAKKVLTNEYTSDKIIIRKRGKNEQKEKRYW